MPVTLIHKSDVLTKIAIALSEGDVAPAGRSFDECVRGQVTEECGGNPVARA